MTPTTNWSVDAVLQHYRTRGRVTGVPWPILAGGQSHAPKWHAFDIAEHVRRAVVIAEALVDNGWARESLIATAAWHDIGKVIAVQFDADGPTFHDHEEVGASYLQQYGFPDELVAAVRCHGRLRRSAQAPAGPNSRLWLELELCDELAKWTDNCFPPQGGARTRHTREDLLRKLRAASIHPDAIAVAARAASDDLEGER